MAIAIAMALTSPSLSLPRLLPSSPSLSPLPLPLPLSCAPPLSLSARFVARAATPPHLDSDLGRRIDFEPEDPLQDIGAGGPGSGNGAGSGGGGGGGGGDGESEDFEEEEAKNKMLMSQKFTLAYAALVGAGGIIGFLKKGSMKSAAAGGLSSLLLLYVYTQLPVNPTFASSLGLGISGALLMVMGSRFKKSGKMFPAGVVSLVSLFMTGGYLHAILRAGAGH